MTALRLNRTHFPVTALGPGRRAGIWVQGCTLGCAGCVAADTWARDGGGAVGVDMLLGWLDSLPGRVDGVTVSGGEPFQQAAAVAELLAGVRDWRGSRPVDVLVYSGYPLHRLRRSAPARRVLDLADAVMTGPYVARRPSSLPWRGSSNQSLVPLTALGRERYGGVPDDGPRMQICQEGDRVWFVGIPRPGEPELVVERLAASGVEVGEVTWRT
ncbi:4Fe-4S single cluster domain-containing protein [Actinomadura fibrosa]|uniref:4Fe-4S single cluster domain-containing protein n=1 Tax=Actinomadura fibrosa TaxID=111802 RepID=A0ABW2XEV2_9ACTN|nr:4Fe-4S single cluster domain-containing protein [Actinomadura fibrosa]